MAAVYGHRYTIEFTSEDGLTDVRVELHQDGYTYGEEPNLIGTDDPVFLEYGDDEGGGDDPNWTIALSKLTIRVNDRAGRLSALSGIEEKEVVCYVYANETLVFEGYVVPGQYIYDRHLSSVAEITCVRGESFMRSRIYRALDNTPFTGLVSPLEIIRNCFILSGNTGYIVSAMYWLPRLASTNLLSTQDPLRQLRQLQDEYVDEEGNPITCWDVLQITLRQYQLQLWNDADSWFVGQRVKVVTDNEFEAFIHTDLSTSAAIDLPYAIEIWNADRTTLQGYTISHTRPFKYAGAIYNHLGPEAGVLHFGGFEQFGFADTDILKGETAGANGATDVWIVSDDLGGIELSAPGATITLIEGPRAGTRVSSAKSLSIPAEYAGSSYTLPTDLATVQALFAGFDYVYQETSGFIEGGSDRTLILRAYVSMQWASPVAQTTEVFFCLRAKVEDYWLVANGSGKYELNDSPSSNTHYNVFKIDYIGNDWVELVLETEVLDDAGTPITGPLYVELIAGLEANNPVGQLSTNSRWDEVSFEVIDADGNRENQATQAVAVYQASNNTYGPEPAVLLFGDGPTTGHKRRLQIVDGASSLVDVAGDWQVGRTFTGDDSGLSHLEFWAREMLKQHQYPLLRADFELLLHGELIDVLSPASALRDERHLTLSQDVLTGAGSITVVPDTTIDPQKYGVVICKRDIVIGGAETHRVLHAVLTDEADNEWTLYLADTLAAGYLAGDTVVQTIDYSWNRWRYSFKRNVAQISAVEILAGDEPDVVCNYDVKPGSLQATSLTDIVGIPCADEITPVYEPPTAEAGTIFFTTGTSSNSQITANSLMRRNPDGSLTVLRTFAGAPGDLSVDETDLWVYCGYDDQIWKFRLDGSEPELVHDHGTGSVLGIQYMPTGSAAGYIYWIFEDSLGDFRVRRVYKDGTGSGQVSTGTFEGAGGIRRYSDSLLYCNGQYITTSVFSVGITPTNIPAVVNSNNGAGSNSGIAIDFDNDAVFVNQGGGGSQNLVKYDPPNNATAVDYTAVISPASGGYLNYDSAGARLLIPGTGLKSRAISSPSSESEITPLTGGSGTTGDYEVFSAYAVQG